MNNNKTNKCFNGDSFIDKIKRYDTISKNSPREIVKFLLDQCNLILNNQVVSTEEANWIILELSKNKLYLEVITLYRSIYEGSYQESISLKKKLF